MSSSTVSAHDYSRIGAVEPYKTCFSQPALAKRSDVPEYNLLGNKKGDAYNVYKALVRSESDGGVSLRRAPPMHKVGDSYLR